MLRCRRYVTKWICVQYLSVGFGADGVVLNKSSSGSSANKLPLEGDGLGDFRLPAPLLPPDGGTRPEDLASRDDSLSSSDQSSSAWRGREDNVIVSE